MDSSLKNIDIFKRNVKSVKQYQLIIMHDKILREDLINLTSEATNININQYIYEKMRRLIKCRTEDKIQLNKLFTI